jgi:hypothetical protein
LNHFTLPFAMFMAPSKISRSDLRASSSKHTHPQREGDNDSQGRKLGASCK